MKFEDYLKSQVDDPKWDLIFWWDRMSRWLALFKSAESLYRDRTYRCRQDVVQKYPLDFIIQIL